MRSFFAATALLVIVGVFDDFSEFSYHVRFVAQLLAAVLIAVAGPALLHDLGYLFHSESLFSLGLFAIPVTLFAVIGVINALNMSDGIDGLSGSLALVALSATALTAWQAGADYPLSLIMVCIGGTGGFLLFNLRLPGRLRAAVFLGDAGSMFLGLVVAWFLITLSQGESRVMSPVTALWFVAVPLFDTISLMVRRIRRGHSPFYADHHHIHHALLRIGFSVNQVLGLLVLIALLMASIGWLGLRMSVPEPVMFFGILAAGVAYHYQMTLAWSRGRLLGRPLGSMPNT